MDGRREHCNPEGICLSIDSGDIAFPSKHLVPMQYFAILRDTGESKIKEEFGNEISKTLLA